MAILGILSAKGGVGGSLLATNLGCALSNFGAVALVDLHPGCGVDALLLDLAPKQSWADLLPVAKEIQERHFELGRTPHSSGLELFAAPDTWELGHPFEAMQEIIQALNKRVAWVILDLPLGWSPQNGQILSLVSQVLLVTTADPLALSANKRLYEHLPADIKDRCGLVLNQYTRRHPLKPRQLTEAMDIELLATLPTDVRAVGYQVNFGRASVLDPRSAFGRGVTALAGRLNKRLNVKLIGQGN
jgi:pilus assembly protein CpaE